MIAAATTATTATAVARTTNHGTRWGMRPAYSLDHPRIQHPEVICSIDPVAAASLSRAQGTPSGARESTRRGREVPVDGRAVRMVG